MFEIVPEAEFEVWFAGLPEPLAEEVTSALDLIATAGGALMPERLSRVMLWYDGVGDGAGEGNLFGTPYTYRMLWAHHARDHLEWRQEVVLTLESSAFHERLVELSPELSRQVVTQVDYLKRKLKHTRTVGALNPVAELPPAERGMQRDFLALLELLGLHPGEVLGCGSGLRELSITCVDPWLRLLVGLDFPNRRLLAILGEALDRRYYGDSVRRAEARWKRYLQRASSRTKAVSP